MQRDLHGLISLTSSVVRQWLQISVKADDDDAAFFSLFLLYFVSVIVLSPTLVAVMGSLMPHGPFTQPTGGLHRTVLLNVLGNTLYFGSVCNALLVVTLRLYRLLPSLFVVSFYFVFLKWANPGLFLCLFSSFPHYTIQIWIDKSIDGVLGTRTQCNRMEGADESTELLRHPFASFFNLHFLCVHFFTRYFYLSTFSLR